MSTVQKCNVPSLPPATKIYSHYTKGAGLIYCSGQIGQDENGQLVGDVSAQTEQVLKNLTEVLEHAGSDWDHVLKVNIFLKKMSDFNAINEVYTRMLPDEKPARTCVQAGALPRDCDIEIEAVAVPK